MKDVRDRDRSEERESVGRGERDDEERRKGECSLLTPIVRLLKF